MDILELKLIMFATLALVPQLPFVLELRSYEQENAY